MRRRPNDTNEYRDSQIFSPSAWGNEEPSYLAQENTIDLSKYAASSIPEGNARSARTARHSPSPHSSYYEPSGNVTNSEHDPFSHSLYDGRPAPVQQNASFEDMPSPVRKSRLGGPIQGIAPESLPQASATSAPPINPVPTMAPAPAMYSPAQTAPQVPAAAPTPPAPQQAYEPIAAPAPAPTQPQISNHVEVQPEVPLSDFEKEFIHANETTNHLVEDVIDLTEEQVIDLPKQNQAWAAPSLFTTPPTQTAPAISYHTNDEFFGTQYGEESDSDRLYKDPREPRETVQIDLDFVKRQFNKLTLNKIVIIAIAIALFAAAYFVMKPSPSTPQNLPANSSVSVDSPTGKTVVDNTVNQPNVTLAPAQSTDNGPIVEYDDNGNVIYSNTPNQNFNGE